MKISRRIFARGIVLGAALGANVRRSFADSLSYDPLTEPVPLPSQYQSLGAEPPMNQEFADQVSVQGTLQPTSDEVTTANKIIEAVSKLEGARPIEIVGFLLEVARGKYDPEWRSYTRAWPVDAPANPLILDFFRATKTSPVGDTTAWCAAFVNWCISKAHGGRLPAGASPPTGSAASASFRTWGKEFLAFDPKSGALSGSFTPALGDLVVFQEILPSGQSDPVHGHVSFFVKMDTDGVWCAGGNQFEGRPVVHAINSKRIPKLGKLQLHSIRRDPAL
jgi:CHAP domain